MVKCSHLSNQSGACGRIPANFPNPALVFHNLPLPPCHDYTSLIAGVVGGAGGFLLLAAAFGARVSWNKKKAVLAELEAAIRSNEAFDFPLHVLSLPGFVAMGSLRVHEEVVYGRGDKSTHKIFDLVNDAIHFFQGGARNLIFLSHQVRALIHVSTPALTPLALTHTGRVRLVLASAVARE